MRRTHRPFDFITDSVFGRSAHFTKSATSLGDGWTCILWSECCEDPMLVMVVERFEPGTLSRIRDRFISHGRMLPETVQYIDSWISIDGSHCYQLMQTSDESALQPWFDAW